MQFCCFLFYCSGLPFCSLSTLDFLVVEGLVSFYTSCIVRLFDLVTTLHNIMRHYHSLFRVQPSLLASVLLWRKEEQSSTALDGKPLYTIFTVSLSSYRSHLQLLFIAVRRATQGRKHILKKKKKLSSLTLLHTT